MTASIWAPNGFSPEVVPFAFFEGNATIGQTVIDISPYTALLDSQLQVFVGGELQNTNLWNIVGTTVVLTSGMSAGQAYRVDIYAAAPVVDAELPAQTGHAGEVLKTDGTGPYWDGLEASEIAVNPVIAIYPTANNVQDVLEAAAAAVGGGFLFPPLYGAIGDGVTDDTAALNYVLSLGLKVGFGDYTLNYRVTNSLIPQNNQTLYGGGARLFMDEYQKPLIDCSNKTDVTISFLNMTGKQMITTSAGSFVLGRAYSIVDKSITSGGTTDFTLVGAANNTRGTFFVATGPGLGNGLASTFYNTPNSQDIAVKAATATNILVHHCSFNRFAYSGMMVTADGTNIKFQDNRVNGPGYAVLNPLGLADPQVPGFRNCTGITGVRCAGLEIIGNEIQNTSHGIYVGQQTNGFNVHRNRVLNTIVEHGMYCDSGARNGVISHNEFFNTKLIGYKLQWYDSNVITEISENVIFANNTLDTCGGDGMIALNSSIATVANISGYTIANPGVITTTAAHGLVVGDKIVISGVNPTNTINQPYYVNTVPSANTFTVKDADGVLSTLAYAAYINGGTVSKPRFAKNIIMANNTLRNIGQDGFSMRYVDGGICAGNTLDGAAVCGVRQLYCINIDTSDNLIRNSQYQGIYTYSPYAQNTIDGNTLVNVGAAGDDTAGGSSGIYGEGNGGGEITNNTIIGEATRTKMLYAVQLGSGAKPQWGIGPNRYMDAESAGVAIHNLDNRPLKFMGPNLGTAASGNNAYVGLPTALPTQGNPVEDYWGSAAPTTGTYIQGNRLHVQFPVEGSAPDFLSTASGTPGTWRPEGMVHKVAATQALQGTYAPTCTATSGITGGTAGVSFGTVFYSVYGNQVRVTGSLVGNVTTIFTTINISFTVPIASAAMAAAGVMTSGNLNITVSGALFGDGVNNDRVRAAAVVTDGNGNTTMFFDFVYTL